jgi:hypothetical protein
LVALKVIDIDSQRMTLRVEQGKGQRDRYVMSRRLESGATAGLAVSGPEPGQPDVGPPTQPRCARSGAVGWDRQAGVGTYVAS